MSGTLLKYVDTFEYRLDQPRNCYEILLTISNGSIWCSKNHQKFLVISKSTIQDKQMKLEGESSKAWDRDINDRLKAEGRIELEKIKVEKKENTTSGEPTFDTYS